MRSTTIIPFVTLSSLIQGMAIDPPPSTNSHKVPTLATRGDSKHYLWETDLDGDVHVEVSDKKLNFGHRVPSTTLDEIKEVCKMELGCQHGPTDPITAKSWMVDGRWGSEKIINMEINAQFASPGTPGDKTDILRIAKEVFQKLYAQGAAERHEGVQYFKKCLGGRRHGCDPAGGVGPFFTDQWTSTGEMIISIMGPRVDKQVYFHVKWSYPKAASMSGLCSAFIGTAGAAAAVAGSGWGAALGLGYMACLAA